MCFGIGIPRCLIPVLNRRLALKGLAPQTLTFYEMIGAAATCLLASIIYQPQAITHLPSPDDWLWLGLLAGVCTVWAFSTHIKLLKHFNAFTTNLAFNFEPVYGILLAALIFGEAYRTQCILLPWCWLYYRSQLNPLVSLKEKQTRGNRPWRNPRRPLKSYPGNTIVKHVL